MSSIRKQFTQEEYDKAQDALIRVIKKGLEGLETSELLELEELGNFDNLVGEDNTTLPNEVKNRFIEALKIQGKYAAANSLYLKKTGVHQKLRCIYEAKKIIVDSEGAQATA